MVLAAWVAAWGEPAPLPRGDWVAHGFPAKARDALRKHLRDSVERGEVPGGSLLLMHKGEVIFREGFGYAHIKRKRPFTADAPCRIASLSKPIIATLIVKLAAQGTLDLDKPIDAYLPVMEALRLKSGEPPAHQPTLRQCLKHTAGFLSDYEPGGRPWLRLKGKGLTLAQVVEREAHMPMARNPGKRFAYSGIGYDVAGRIVEVATQRALNNVLRDEICKPLGMTHTTYYPDAATRAQIPSFYWLWRSDGKFRRRLNRPPVQEGHYISVGGGITSTLDDLARFLLMHQNEGRCNGTPFIPRDALHEMYRRRRPGPYYGLGFTLGPAAADGLAAWIYHSGSSGTQLWLERRHHVIGVFFTQHRMSAGKKMPESEKKIPKGASSWQKLTKKRYIDPVLGWTAKSKR